MCHLGSGLLLWQSSPRTSAKLWYGVGGAGVLSLGEEPLHTPEPADNGCLHPTHTQGHQGCLLISG